VDKDLDNINTQRDTKAHEITFAATASPPDLSHLLCGPISLHLLFARIQETMPRPNDDTFRGQLPLRGQSCPRRWLQIPSPFTGKPRHTRMPLGLVMRPSYMIGFQTLLGTRGKWSASGQSPVGVAATFLVQSVNSLHLRLGKVAIKHISNLGPATFPARCTQWECNARMAYQRST
jgi:hypothetical protein